MEAAVETLLAAADGLIAMLDALDIPHEDLEDATEDNDVQDMSGRLVDDEPSLGSVAADCDYGESQERWAAGTADDCEGPEDDL